MCANVVANHMSADERRWLVFRREINFRIQYCGRNVSDDRLITMKIDKSLSKWVLSVKEIEQTLCAIFVCTLRNLCFLSFAVYFFDGSSWAVIGIPLHRVTMIVPFNCPRFFSRKSNSFGVLSICTTSGLDIWMQLSNVFFIFRKRAEKRRNEMHFVLLVLSVSFGKWW